MEREKKEKMRRRTQGKGEEIVARVVVNLHLDPRPHQTLGHKMSGFQKIFYAAVLYAILLVSHAKDEETVHEILVEYGLPKGLLPDAVLSFSLNDDGEFEVELGRECYVHFGDHLVYYDKKITGKLLYREIKDLNGIQAKKFFLWVSVTGIKMDKGSNSIEFFVGIISEKMPVKEFKEIHKCKSSVYADRFQRASIAEV